MALFLKSDTIKYYDTVSSYCHSKQMRTQSKNTYQQNIAQLPPVMSVWVSVLFLLSLFTIPPQIHSVVPLVRSDVNLPTL